MNWQNQAICRNMPTQLFIEPTPTPTDATLIEQACRHLCPVRLQCAQQALAKAEAGQEYTNAYIAGVWHVPAKETTGTTRWRTMCTLLAIIRAYTPKETP